MSNWEQIRTQWVLGNNKSAKEMLLKKNKKNLLRVAQQAMINHLEMLAPGTVRSGDLTDLLEIIRSIQREG